MVRKAGSKNHGKAGTRPKTPKTPKTPRVPTQETVVAPVSFADDRTVTNQYIRTDNAVQKLEYARNLAYMQARLAIGDNIRTQNRSYKILREVSRGVFSFKYEVEQKNGKRYYLRVEPQTENKAVKRFKSLKFELAILGEVRHLGNSSSGKHFPKFHDAGTTIDFKFIITQALGDTLYDISRKYMKSAFSLSTALRVAIQILRAISDFHSLGFLHRQLKPEVFAIGRFNQIRTVYLCDFGEPFVYRDPKTHKIRHPRKHVRIIGTLRYMSRNSQLNKEHGRRDDIEAWAYLSMEFFDLAILPWRNDQVNSAVLDKKQKLIDGAYPAAFSTVSMRYKQILRYISNMKYHERPDYHHLEQLLLDIRVERNVDFTLPYDWENLPRMRDIVGRDPLSDSADPDARVEPVDPIQAKTPKKPAKSPTPTVLPATLPYEKSDTEPEEKLPVPVPVKVKRYLEKVIDVEMSGDCLNQQEKFYQECQDRSQSPAPQSPKKLPKMPRSPLPETGSERAPKRNLSETEDAVKSDEHST